MAPRRSRSTAGIAQAPMMVCVRDPPRGGGQTRAQDHTSKIIPRFSHFRILHSSPLLVSWTSPQGLPVSHVTRCQYPHPRVHTKKQNGAISRPISGQGYVRLDRWLRLERSRPAEHRWSVYDPWAEVEALTSIPKRRSRPIRCASRHTKKGTFRDQWWRRLVCAALPLAEA